MLSLNTPLILRLMAASIETAWDDETFREIVVKNYSFGEIQARLREIDEANLQLRAIQNYKDLDCKAQIVI